ncbi:NADP-dependent oxidoreductase domain-containing protein [Chytriomyces sp. MP71]|nr:NADP-dependent oxidoreductase domain-containing protein [Chytriomyces sp. MP71]
MRIVLPVSVPVPELSRDVSDLLPYALADQRRVAHEADQIAAMHRGRLCVGLAGAPVAGLQRAKVHEADAGRVGGQPRKVGGGQERGGGPTEPSQPVHRNRIETRETRDDAQLQLGRERVPRKQHKSEKREEMWASRVAAATTRCAAVRGRATPAATRRHADRHPRLFRAEHRGGGLALSSVAIGCFRARDPAALAHALRSGANLVDTAAHFGSEKTVGEAIAIVAAEGSVQRESIAIVSKCGHILDKESLSLIQSNSTEWAQETILLSEFAAHCIAPSFISHSISRSLLEMNLESIDVYLINCPERLLAGKLKNGSKVSSVYPFLKRAFEQLEIEVETGRISYYGIASNSIANRDTPDFIDIEECVRLAREVSGEKHHFAYIEYPLNVFERDAVEDSTGSGAKVLAEIAEEHGLYQLTQRPLNVIAGGSVRCLADKVNTIENDESKVTAELTTFFERVAELESDLLSLVGDSNEDIATISHFIWSTTLSENLAKLLSSNAFATQHYISRTVLPSLKTDTHALLASFSEPPADVSAWCDSYSESLHALCDAISRLALAREAAMNAEAAGVLAAMAPSVVRAWRGAVSEAEHGAAVDVHAVPPLSDVAIRLVRGALETKTGGRGGTVLVGMRTREHVDAAILAGSGDAANADDVESAFLCSLLD